MKKLKKYLGGMLNYCRSKDVQVQELALDSCTTLFKEGNTA